jgi:hypothetical protein
MYKVNWVSNDDNNIVSYSRQLLLKGFKKLLWRYPPLSMCAWYHMSFYITPIGFFFSEDEPTALVQNYGGPCSVIASVQVEYFGCEHSNKCFTLILYLCH